ncbi:MAG TPA: DUF2079 domain-containing protein [Polyangiaceae bacterium]|nr:DUF2079 domain-containing protein [Polyangiaceae bacterium]
MSESREREGPAPSEREPGQGASTGGSPTEAPQQVPDDPREPRLASSASPPPPAPPARDRHDDEDDDDDDDEDDEDDAWGDTPQPDSVRPDGDQPADPVSEDYLWGSVARSVTLAALIGFALITWVQLSFGSRWVNELLGENVLPPGQRVTIMKASVGGAVLAAGAVGYLIWSTLRRKGPITPIERWCWFASPLMLLPAASSVLRYRPWVNEHARLLPIVLFLAIVLEVLVFQALRASPPQVSAWWADLRRQLPEQVRKHGPLVVVLLGSLFYVGFFCFYLLRWHYKLKTGNFDLSINNNLMYGGLHGEFLQSPVVFPQDPGKYLANHAKFGGYLFLPLYALFPRPETLLVLQSTLIGLSALPLWGFARRHVSDWMAALVALAYLAYYPMHGASFSEFQYVPIAGFFVLMTVWAAETRRWVVFGIFLVAGITMREDIPVGMAVVGGFLLLSGYRPLPGLVMAALSTTYFLVLRFHVMEEAGDWWFPNMYKELWADGEKGFRSVIKTLLSNPLFVLSKILVEKKLLYLMHLLVPLVFLPARRWYLWAAFLPGTLLTLLITNYDPPITFSFHYVMHWTPYLFLASVLALESIGKQPLWGQARMYAAAAAVAFSSLVLSYNFGAFSQRSGSFKGGFQRVEFELSDAERERYANLQALIALIPKDASVAATEKVGPHVSSRVKMYTMRHGPQNAEYVLASSRELRLSRTKPKLLEALSSGKYGVVKRIADMALLKRGHSTAENEQMIRDWRLSDAKVRPSRAPRREREPEPEPEVDTKSPDDDPDARGGPG